MKQDCPFYISFIDLKNNVNKYRCNGINAIHICARNPLTWDRYARYRNQDPAARQLVVRMIKSEIKAEQAALILNSSMKSNS